MWLGKSAFWVHRVRVSCSLTHAVNIVARRRVCHACEAAQRTNALTDAEDDLAAITVEIRMGMNRCEALRRQVRIVHVQCANVRFEDVYVCGCRVCKSIVFAILV